MSLASLGKVSTIFLALLDVTTTSVSALTARPISACDTARARLPLRAATEYDPGPAREDATRQIDRRFVRVQNPDLVMAVFPHLAKGKYPIPGYQTIFPMYESVDYLLPGEASGNLDGLR